MINLEIETKYNTELQEYKFSHVCGMSDPSRVIRIQGWDYFYSSPRDTESFFRYRESTGDTELTFKRKLYKKDSVIRTEHNLHISQPLLDKGEAFCRDMGYEFNTSIYKEATVYEYADFILCYYVVFSGLKGAMRKFIEIELKYDPKIKTNKRAMSKLTEIESNFKALGISKKGRLKQSLFEMYRRK